MERHVGTKTSPGSIYFNKEDATPNVKKECLDFIGFSDTPTKICESPHKSMFAPRNYSSPNRGNKTPGFGISPNNRNQSWQGNSANRGPSNYSSNWNNSPNNSRNNSWQGTGNSYNRGGGRKFNRGGGQHNQQHKNKFEPFNSNKFLHPSFTEDPWADLEKQLQQKKEQQKEEGVKTNE